MIFINNENADAASSATLTQLSKDEQEELIEKNELFKVIRDLFGTVVISLMGSNSNKDVSDN